MELNNGETPNPQTPQTQNPQTPQTQNPHHSFYDDDDFSNCSTPYVSAPSSPGRAAGPTISGFFYNAPPGLIDLGNEEGDRRGRDPRFMRSRRTRSMSPMRTMSLVSEIYSTENEADRNNNAELGKNDEDNDNVDDDSEKKEELSGASSRSSSAGRNSKRWVFLKEFLHRSKSEGQQRSNANIHKLWGTNLFSGSGKESGKKAPKKESLNLGAKAGNVGAKKATAKPANGVMGKRRNAPSLHELHYTANRAHAEEMRKKTYLPYKQGLLGCLGFSSKGYGAAMNTRFARALNPVSSR